MVDRKLQGVQAHIQKQIDKAKSPKGKAKYENIQKEMVREFKKYVKVLENVITFQNLLVDAKMVIVSARASFKGNWAGLKITIATLLVSNSF